ncbi:unnamed protein product [Ectocarpus sp. 12 AP-2014]
MLPSRCCFLGRCYPPPGQFPSMGEAEWSESQVWFWGVNIAELMTYVFPSLFSSHFLVPLRTGKRTVQTAVGLVPVPMGVGVCLFKWTVVPVVNIGAVFEPLGCPVK